MMDYGPSPSNQTQLSLEGLTDEGQKLMEEARTWAGRHYNEFLYFKQLGHKAMGSDGKASPGAAREAMRAKFGISFPNKLSAPLARIAMEEDPGCNFRVAKSKTDGFTTAKL